MAIGGINIGQELLNVPMGDMIRSMAMAIADAQWSLDKSSIRVAEMMSGQAVLRDLDRGTPLKDKNNNILFNDTRVSFGYVYTSPPGSTEPKRESIMVSMMELGFTPNFYQFVDTIIEVKIAVTVTGSTENESSNQYDSTTNSDSSSYDYGYARNWWGHGRLWGAQSSQSRTVQTTQVNGSYSAKYGYSAEGASLLRTKLVPIPPPAILEDRIRNVMSMERSYELWKLLDSRQKTLTAAISAATDPAKKAAAQADLAQVETQLKDLLEKFGSASA